MFSSEHIRSSLRTKRPFSVSGIIFITWLIFFILKFKKYAIMKIYQARKLNSVSDGTNSIDVYILYGEA